MYLKKKFFQRSIVREGLFGIRYYVEPQSTMDNQIVKRGIIDDWDFLQKLVGVIPPDGVVLDIGANVGLLTLPFAKLLVPQGRVIAFEPDSENFRQLQKNISLNACSNVQVFAMALQDNPNITTLQFHVRRAIDGDGNINRGLSSIKAISLHTRSSYSVPCSTVDRQVESMKLSRVDFMKIDVEGAEFFVLSGAKNTIAKYQPFIQYEFSNTLDTIMNEQNTAACFEMLKGMGYRQFYIANDTGVFHELLSPDGKLPDANIVCCPAGKLPSFFLESR